MAKQKTVLLVAFDFPPATSPGVERTLKFAKYIQQCGWQPIVLTVNQETFSHSETELELEHRFPVYRTFCLDVSKHLAYKGKYFGWMKKPDRYWGWCFTAIPKGVALVKKFQVSAVFSTYPLLTSHLVAGGIAKLTATPWLADYRDPLQCYYDEEVYDSFSVHRWLDRLVIKHCTKAIFVTKTAMSLYQKLHPSQEKKKFCCIANGFDTSNLLPLEAAEIETEQRFVLLHTGSLYARGRDPQVLFLALSQLKKQGDISSANFVLRLRGEHNQGIYQPKAQALDIDDLIEFLPRVSHAQCLLEMQQVSALLLVQGDIFYSQIPGKLYEYLASNKPIMALTKQGTETANLVTKEHGAYQVNSVEDVVAQIKSLVNTPKRIKRDVDKYERKYRAFELAQLLDDICQNEFESKGL